MRQIRNTSELQGRLRSNYGGRRQNTEHGCMLRLTRHSWPRRLNARPKSRRNGKLHLASAKS